MKIRNNPGEILIEHLNPVIFDDRITQHIARDGVEILAGLQGDFEKLALPDVFDPLMTEAVQSGADGLALRIEDGWFEGYVDASFHNDPILEQVRLRPRNQGRIGFYLLHRTGGITGSLRICENQSIDGR